MFGTRISIKRTYSTDSRSKRSRGIVDRGFTWLQPLTPPPQLRQVPPTWSPTAQLFEGAWWAESTFRLGPNRFEGGVTWCLHGVTWGLTWGLTWFEGGVTWCSFQNKSWIISDLFRFASLPPRNLGK